MKTIGEREKENLLAENNLGLVRLCANRFRGRGIEYDDLYSAGCIGLVKASKAFDTDRGVQFSTYAVPVIMGEIKRLFRDGGTVKVSRHLKELSLKIGRIREKYIMENGREPAISELSLITGQSPDSITEAITVGMPVLSLTADSGDNSGEQIDIPAPSPDEEMSDRLSVMQVISGLSPEDRRLIYLRYFRGLTQVRTAEIMNMTQVQVSRREKKILAGMRRELGD